jgi:hypothetical protein
LDGRYCYVWLNERLAKMNGLPVTAHLGKPAGQIGEALGKTVMTGIESLMAGGAEWQAEVWHAASAPSATPRCHRITLIPHKTHEAGLHGVALLVADVSAEKSAAWALAERFHEQQMWQELAPRFEAVGRRGLAHELRIRLMPMLTVAQMLKGANQLDAATLEWAGQSLEKKILELSALASSLQAIVPAGLPSGPAPLDLRQLAELAAEPVRPLLARLSLPSQGAWVLGDPARLIHPLVLCLLKAAQPGGGLSLSIHTESGQALLSIGGQPGGSLLPQQAPAQQPDPAASSEDMGLMLAKMLVEEQGGRLSFLDGEAGNGEAAFRLSLPLADTSERPADKPVRPILPNLNNSADSSASHDVN